MSSSDFKLILSEFGLQNVKPKLYMPGEPLQQHSGDFRGKLQPELKQNSSVFPVQSLPNRESALVSSLGTPVFSDLQIKDGPGYQGFTRQRNNSLYPVLFTVSIPKKVVKTDVQGRDGTFKEYINLGDAQVTIRGLLTSPDPYSFPESQAIQLIRICKAPVAVSVVSWYLKMFGIYNLVFEEPTFSQVAGKQNVQAFEVRAISDTPVNIIKREDR